MFPNLDQAALIEISIEDQLLRFSYQQNQREFVIGTAVQGAGEQMGSGKTPRGWHRIVAAIGANEPINRVFVGRRPTHEIYSQDLAQQHPERDWILTRILWLQGLEVGRNRMGQVDTMRRYIYIHGVPDHKVLGVPGSKGCINMHNNDLLTLFDLAPAGTLVWIQEASFSRISCRSL